MAAQLSSVKSEGKLFKVAVLGATDTDADLLHRIFGVTKYRARCYQMIKVDDSIAGSSLKDYAHAHIYIVNLHNPKALQVWRSLSALIPPDLRKPVLKISKVTPSTESGSEFTISWPINPAKVLQTLDNYTIRHLHYYPEFEIGGEEAPSQTDAKHLRAIGLSSQLQNATKDVEAKVRVLIADDSLAVRRQLKMEFDSMGAALDVVEDGEMALKAAEEGAYDLILLDVVMPGLDGYAACKQIKKTKLNKNTPVVMLTSKSSSFDKLKGVLAGCDTYLTKPISHNEFTEITQKHLAQKIFKGDLR